MSYVIFEKVNTKIVRIMRNGYWQDAMYKTPAAAQAGFTRLRKQGKVHPIFFDILPVAEFRKIEKTVQVRNLMSGKMVTQRVNTPLCCDVSSETYWSL
jgi:hypothetical protein